MSPITASSTSPQTAPHSRAPARRGSPTSLWTCLLVSSDEKLLQRMESAATEEGWETIVSSDPKDSVRQAVLHRVPLALIDVSAGGKETYDDLIRLLNPGAGGLVVVCDREANAEGELWARQRGAWMYLPGVGDQTDLELICREAKLLAEKLNLGGRKESMA